MGGALNAIEQGYVQQEIHEPLINSAGFRSSREVVVGVNRFVVAEETPIARLKLDPTIEASQRDRLKQIRARRDNHKVNELRTHLAKEGPISSNVMPLFITCLENDVTLGEICDT